MANFRVLVVDDSTFARMAMAKLIKQERPAWAIEQAANGSAALEQCEKAGTFDLITLDMHMPRMDGLEFAAELRKRKVNSRLVLVTANVQAAVQERAEQLKLHFVPKPVTPSKVTKLLQKLEV